ncbi:unnamed protein product, partial [Penicillium discolor]
METMRIHIATDHAGLEFSTRLQEHLRAAGHEVIDHGPVEYDALDDYPAFCIRAAQAVVVDQATGVPALGVVFGGSGNGEQIAANKVAGIRAALGRFAEGAAVLDGRKAVSVQAVGKQMFLEAEGDLWLRVHLGLYGAWDFAGEILVDPTIA